MAEAVPDLLPEGPERPVDTYRRVIRLAYPVVLSSLAATLMGLTDTLFMGWVGTSEQGGVGLGGMLGWVFVSFFVGTLNVVNTYVAQQVGAGEDERCGEVVSHGLFLALGFTVLLELLAPQTGRVVAIFGAPAAVAAVATAYSRIRVAGAPFHLLEATLTSFLRGIGDTRTPMKVSLGVVLLNLPLNYWLIFGGLGVPALGPAGAAYATVAAQGCGVVALALVCYRRVLRERFGIRLWRRLRARQLSSMLQVGAPIGVGWLLEMAIWLAFSAFISSLGKESLAAHNIVLQVIHVSFMPGLALSVAATTLVGQHLGARDPAGAARAGYAALKLGIAFMTLMGMVFLLGGGLIASAFNQDPTVIAIARKLFLIAAAFQMFDAMGMVSGGILRGAGDTRWPMAISVGFSWLVFLPLIWLLGHRFGWGVTGSWVGATVYIIGLGLTLLARVASGRWRSYSVLESAAPDAPAVPSSSVG
jgi:MATE family multidrug resistance protein